MGRVRVAVADSPAVALLHHHLQRKAGSHVDLNVAPTQKAPRALTSALAAALAFCLHSVALPLPVLPVLYLCSVCWSQFLLLPYLRLPPYSRWGRFTSIPSPAPSSVQYHVSPQAIDPNISRCGSIDRIILRTYKQKNACTIPACSSRRSLCWWREENLRRQGCRRW